MCSRVFKVFNLSMLNGLKGVNVSAEPAFYVRSWAVGHRTVTLKLQRPERGVVAHACMEWSTEVPRQLTDEERAAYYAGYFKALAELGLSAAVVEL
jgi:hypothetical protein